MIESVVSVALPVLENLEIKKNRVQNGSSKRRISIVTGIHGDELEGQYVCYLLNSFLQQNISLLDGIVDIYPAMNPLGIDSITRGVPNFDLDMNRIFPGCDNGATSEYVAHKIIEDLKGSTVCIDIHASNIFLTEMPQVRINELNKERLVPLAKKINIDFIWVHSNSTVLESTLAYSLNSTGTDTLVVEMGVGMRITQDYCRQLVDGILYLMHDLGMYKGDVKPPKKALIATETDAVDFLNAPVAGIFIQKRHHGEYVKKDDVIGLIVNPLSGKTLEQIKAPSDGLLFTIREYPVVAEGSLMGRILKKAE